MDWLDDGPISGEDLMAEIIEFYPETVEYLAGIGMLQQGIQRYPVLRMPM